MAHHLESTAQRPFVCIVPGEASESHEGYLTRLLTYTFPRILKSAADRELGDPEYLEWPGFARSEQEAVESFESALADQLACPAAEAVAVLHAKRSPIIVHTEVIRSEWGEKPNAVARGFLRFWRDWPDLPPDRILLCLFFLTYRSGDSVDAGSASALDPAVQAFLGQFDLSQPKNVGGIVLPVLRPVSEGDLKSWARHSHVRRIAKIDTTSEEWEETVERIFEERTRVSMRELFPYLKQILVRYRSEVR